MSFEQLDAARRDFLEAIESASGIAEAIEAVRIRFAGRRSGLLKDLQSAIREVAADRRPEYGQKLNELKGLIEARLEAATASASAGDETLEALDVSLPGLRRRRGGEHPVHKVRRRIEEIFLRMGYSVEDGPEVEDDWHNFEALNIPPNHPARDDQDTFYLGAGRLLRTHTSPVQARVMSSQKPPIRVVVPGRVYRRDSDLRHSPMFHQLEGLVVDQGITFSHLKATLETFLHELFPGRLAVRFRPSYFPFTEPSAEVDISCIFCEQRGCGVCSRSGWIEILGAGMVDPRVFERIGIDAEKYTGFAFGLGLDRVAMLSYGIPDLRLMFAGHQSFTRQFR